MAKNNDKMNKAGEQTATEMHNLGGMALIYCRVSTEEQAKDGRLSLKTQRHLCEQALEQVGYKLALNGIYEDPGRSATSMNRPGLQDLLIRIQEDKAIKAVFVQDTDRLARNTGDHITIKSILRKHGVKLISVSQPGIEDTPEGDFMDTIVAAVNQLQSQITGRKTSKSMDQRFRNGWWPTRAPIGYLNVGEKNNPDKRIIIQDPVKAPLVRELFEKYATGSYSVFDLRNELFNKGLTSLVGKKPALAVIFRTLENPFYYGEMNWKGEKLIGNHEPIIKKEVFESCKLVKARRNHFATRERKYNFLLNGYLYSVSGSRYFGEYHPSKNASYYRCHPKDGSGVIASDKPVVTKNIEDYVADAFYSLQFSKRFAERLTIKIREMYEKKKLTSSKQKDYLENKKAGLEKRLEIAEEKLLANVLTDDDFTRIKLRLREQIENVNQEIYKVERSRNIKVDVLQDVLLLGRDIGEAYKKAASDEYRRVYLGLFWDRFELADRKIVKAVPSKLIRAFMVAGSVCINKRQKPIPIETMFAHPSLQFQEAVGISNFRGA